MQSDMESEYLEVVPQDPGVLLTRLSLYMPNAIQLHV